MVKLSALICPLFVAAGRDIDRPLGLLPDCRAVSVDKLPSLTDRLVDSGLTNFIIYEAGAKKDDTGSFALSPDSAVAPALTSLRERYPGCLFIADLCFCQYTTHGHCGVLSGGTLDNDGTLERLTALALHYGRAGAAALMPSGMLDGTVRTLRGALDANGLKNVLIFNQSAKFLSGFYGPFRQATGHCEKDFDKVGYQVSPANAAQALREVALDEDEGADMLFIKPAFSNIDLIYRAARQSPGKIGAFCTSGEHALCFSPEKESPAALEQFMFYLERLKEAGAASIFTYAAPRIASYLRQHGEALNFDNHSLL